MPRPATIALDGPVAVGKSTVGKLLALKLGYRFVDTGLMYRALTWKAIRQDVGLEDEAALTRLAGQTSIDFAPAAEGDGKAVLVDGQEVTAEIRSAEVERGVSLVSRVPGVRQCMVEQQQRLGRNGGIVMAGRDIGTVVLPQAELKLFLEASAEERARRRHLELAANGTANYESILAELKRRDRLDRSRPVSPLRPAPDAKVIDTEGLTLEQVVEAIIALVGE